MQFFGTQKIEGYNPEINENTTYSVSFSDRFHSREDVEEKEGINKCELSCVRTNFNIDFFFMLFVHEDEETDEITFEILKIGQYPTIADLEIGRYKKFSKVLSKAYLREFNKAIGLAANGVGVGSFVYLRRIFESLINKYYEVAKKDKDWDDKEYTKARIEGKIGLLKDYLPEVVVKYKKIYNILSKGIHELEEQECLEYFPIIKNAIVSILEKDYLTLENEIQQKDLEKNIKGLVDKLK
jgi:hypothetical protein